MIAMRAFGEPDAFAAQDLVLRRHLARWPPDTPDPWRPWRSYAAMVLWSMETP